MHRRRVLALLAAGAVPLAGCSSGDDGDGNDTDEGDDGISDIGPGEDGNGSPTNETDDSDGVDDSDTDPGGNESDGDGQTDEQSDGQDGDGDEPTEEALAQEDVDAAQSALSDAVEELESQGTTYGSLSEPGDQGPPVTAAVNGLSAGPVRDQLSSVQTSIDAAREHETTSDQEDVLSAIEAAKDWLHSVLDAYQPVRDVYLEANYAVQDFRAEGSEPDLQAVRRAADQAQSPVEGATDPYATLDGQTVGHLGAISQEGAEAQVQRLTADYEGAQTIADLLESLQGTNDLLLPNHEHYQSGEHGEVSSDELKTAESEYGSAATTAGEIGGSNGAASSYLSCYASNLQHAADRYHSAITNYRVENYEDASGYANEAEAAIEDAEGCSFDWSA